MNNKNTSFKIKVLVLTILFFIKSWSQVTIASDGFNNSSTLFNTTGGEYFNGNSASGDLPKSAPFASEGTHSYGVNSGTATLASNSDINTSAYSSVTMSMRLAAFSIGSTGNGVDDKDIVTIEVSPDGGSSWYSTVRVLGESNACWSFSGGKNASTAYDGNTTPFDFKPNSGGELTSDGYSTITINNLPSVPNLRFKITLLNNSASEQWLVDDFKVTGIVSCIPPVLSTIYPSSGPVGTEVVITASSGDLSGATASFGGVAATVVSTSTTEMTILVPTAATGSLTIKNSFGCIVPVAFTVLKEDKTSCGGGTGNFSDLIISEVYDSNSNNVWHMELYNPTAAPIDLSASNYKFEIYQTKGDPSSLSRTVILSGIVQPGKVFLANLGDSGAPCSKTFDFAQDGQGINDDDQIRLTKNGVLVDVVNCPTTKGYTIERKPTAIGPKTTFVASDWTTSANESCNDLGVFPYTPSAAPTIVTQPLFTPSCSNIVFFVTANEGVVGGNSLAYQWYFTAPNSPTWQPVTDGGVYNGATTSMLEISSISGLLGYQFYCQVRENTATCSSASNAVKISSSSVAAPTLKKTDSNCTSSTGSIEVTAPLGTGFTYSIDGTTYQTSPIFSSLSPKSYNVTVKNSSGCVSLPSTETIATTSTPPAPTLTKTDSSCTSSTGSIEVTAPLGTGFTYSIDGTTYQTSPIFSSLSPKSYNITVKNSSGCVSLPATETIATTSTPLAPTLKKTDSSCTSSTGSIEVTAPLGTGFTYSIDGTTYQSSPIFSSLSPKSYNITVKNSSGCVSLPAIETIATIATPAAPILSKTNPTCTVSTGSIQVNSPLGAGFTYSIDGTTYQTSPIFSSLSPKSYNITVKNSSGCVSLPAVETISTVSRIDPINSVQYICFDKTGLLIAPVIIDTKLSPTDYSFVWTFAGSPISITSSSYVATAVGIYKITATSKTGGCTILFNADVKESKEAIAVATVGNDFDTQQQIIVTVTGGLGNYEYQLDDGLPQSNPILFVSKSGDYTVKVIDKLGCNNFLLPVNVLNFPRFFTPNNDGYNDTWNIEGLNKPEKAIIYIFDRYGKLLKQISPVSKGWDGVYNGVAQPASDYWFRLLYQDSTGANKEFKAHFSLKR